MAVNSSSRSSSSNSSSRGNTSRNASGGVTRTNYNSGGSTKSTSGAGKSSKSPSASKTPGKAPAKQGFFSKLFGSSFDRKTASKPASKTAAPRAGTSTKKAAKTTAPVSATAPTGAPRKATNGVAHISSYTNVGKRSQMATGTITVNGKTYSFKSGGAGKGNLPKGNYTVTRHMNTRTDKKSMMKDGVGYSFALNNKYDARVGATRTSLRIHPDGGKPGTIGCIGIQGNGATQKQFRSDMNRELSRNGGKYSLTVN